MVSTYETVSLWSPPFTHIHTLICWPICWLMMTFTNERDAVTPLSAVMRSSNVRELTSFWMSGSQLVDVNPE